MTVNEFLQRYPDYVASPEEIVSAKFLEREGLRFLIDFGFKNAFDRAFEFLEVGHA